MKPCPFCGGAPVGLGEKFGYRLGRCEACGSVFCIDDVSEDQLAAVYTRPEYWRGAGPYGYEDLSAHEAAMDGVMRTRVEALAKLAPGRRLLEIGPGTGRFIATARAAGWHAVGYDKYPIATSGIPVVSTLAEAPPEVDAICYFDVLEHLQDPIASVRPVVSRLIEGGCVAIGLPMVSGPAYATHGLEWREVKPPEHLALPSALGMRTLLARLDLTPTMTIAHFTNPRPWAFGRRAAAAAGRARERGHGLPGLARALRFSVEWVEHLRHRLDPADAESEDYVTWFAMKPLR